MILTDYFISQKSIQWDYAKQMGIEHAIIRLPETADFDITNLSHWEKLYSKFMNYGLKPIMIEPMPNSLHDPIKVGSKDRDEAIEKVIKMFPIMNKFGIETICTNFMANTGWFRNKTNIIERGGALVTGFDIKDVDVSSKVILDEGQMWNNLEYFLKAIIPYAEESEIKIALHPDDPPIPMLNGTARILTSFDNINKAINIVKSDNLGITMCQATYVAMGEDLEKVIPYFAKENKIFFVHFRDIVGDKNCFRESFHDNGKTDMAKILKLYKDLGVNVPIRVDHVPTMAGDNNDIPGYAAVGRLFAIGYLKGLADGIGSI